MADKLSSSSLSTVIDALFLAEPLGNSVKTMLLEGLPHAVKDGCSHPFQKELVGLTDKVLKSSKEQVAEHLAVAEANLEKAQQELVVLKTAELATKMAAEEAASSSAAAEDAAAAAALAAAEADAEHQEVKRTHQSFLAYFAEQQEERSRVAAVEDGAFRLLVQGERDSETTIQAADVVDKMLRESKAERVLVAAASHALCLLPENRGHYDTMVVEAVAKVLAGRLSDLDQGVRDAEPELHQKKAEIVGAWAIADCAQDNSAAAAAALVSVLTTQADAQAELANRQKRAAEQEEIISERVAKHARTGLQLGQADEALAAVAKIIGGSQMHAVEEAPSSSGVGAISAKPAV